MISRRLLSIAALLLSAVSIPSHAATIVYAFDGNVNTATTNDFGNGVTTSIWSISGTGSQSGTIASERAEGPFKDGNIVNQFTITIPVGVTVDLTQLSFDVGHNITQGSGTGNQDAPGENGLEWELTSITPVGSGVPPTSGSHLMTAGFASYNHVINLSGLTNLNGTSITFTLTDTTGNENNNFNRTFFDNVTVTGTVIPEPSTALLGGLSSLLLLRRRR